MATTLLLKTNPEYEKMLPSLTQEEYSALKQSIQEEGQYFPIIVNSDFEILDGHHRNQVCLELDIEPDFETRHFDDKLSERMFVVEANLRRRQLHPLDSARLGVEIEKIEAERAKQRQGTRTDLTLCSNEQEVSFGVARDFAAHKVGLAPTTYHRAKTILEKGTPELQQKIKDGNESISHAYQTIMQQEHNTLPTKIEIPTSAENLTDELFVTNVWVLPNKRPEGYGSSDYRGNCCPTIIDQCLRRYVIMTTDKENAKILDPMAGSGTFIDVAAKLGFKKENIFAYDLNQKRPDIEIQDAVKLPLDHASLDFVFVHYPYYDMWQYSNNPQDFSNCEYTEFLSRIKDSFIEFKRVLKPNCYLCVLIGNKRESGLIDIEADLSKIGFNIFGKLWDKIITVVGDPAGHASTAHGNWGLVQYRSLKGKWAIQNYDTLLVFRTKKEGKLDD